MAAAGQPLRTASRRTRSPPPRASGPSCSTSVAAFVLKTRLRSRPLKTPRGHRAAPGRLQGLSQDPRRPSRIWVQGQPRRQDTRPISGSFSESGESRERAPDELARPTHSCEPRAPARARSPPPDPLFQTPPPSGREPRSHPRSLRRRTCTDRGPTTSRRCSATA